MTIQEAVSRSVQQVVQPLVNQIDDIHSRMFIDNGKPSVQSSISQLHNHTRLQWAVLVFLLASIGTLAFTIITENNRLRIENKRMGELVGYSHE